MTENENANRLPEDAPPPKDNPVDGLEGLAISTGVFFSRVGGGSGPGWNGNSYDGVPVQLGPCGSVAGDSIESLFLQAQDRWGGGRYAWAGKNSAGKQVRGEIVLGGAPKLLAMHDPVAERAAAAAAWANGPGAPLPGGAGGFAGAPPFGSVAAGFPGGFPGGGGYGQPPESYGIQAEEGWVWSLRVNGYIWVSASGSPPVGYPPRHPPGYQGPAAYHHGGGYGRDRDEDDDEPRGLRREVKELTKFVEKLATGGTSSKADELAMMRLQMEQANNRAAQDRADAESRWTREQATRKEEADSRRDILKTQERLMEKTLEANAGHKPPSRSDVIDDMLKLEELKNNLVGDKREDERSEKMGEKIVGALERFADMGKSWFDSRKDKKDPAPEKKRPAPANGAANGNGAAHTAAPPAGGAADPYASVHEDTARLLKILAYACGAYQEGVSPSNTLWGMKAFCEGIGVDFATLLTSIAPLSANILIGLIRSNEDPQVPALAEPLLAVLDTADGRSWFDSLLGAARKHLKGGGGGPAGAGSPTGGVPDDQMDPPLPGQGPEA